MTEESICMRCAELVRIKVKGVGEAPVEEERICSLEALYGVVMSNDTVQECSRYVEVPGEEVKKK